MLKKFIFSFVIIKFVFFGVVISLKSITNSTGNKLLIYEKKKKNNFVCNINIILLLSAEIENKLTERKRDKKVRQCVCLVSIFRTIDSNVGL